MEALTQAEIDEQKQEFIHFLDTVFNEKYESKIEVNDDGLIEKATIFTRETLEKRQMSLITEVSDAYQHDYQIEHNRDLISLKITFKLITE